MQACRGQALPSWLGGIIHPRGSRLFYSIGHRQAGFWGWQQASGADSWAAGFGARLCAAAAAAAPPSAPQHTHTQPQQFSIFPPSLSALAPRGRVVASAVQVAIAEARNSWSNRRFEAPPPTMVISNTIHGKRHAVQAGSEAGPSAPGGSQSSGFPDTMQLKLANSLRYPAPAAPTCQPRPPPPPAQAWPPCTAASFRGASSLHRHTQLQRRTGGARDSSLRLRCPAAPSRDAGVARSAAVWAPRGPGRSLGSPTGLRRI